MQVGAAPAQGRTHELVCSGRCEHCVSAPTCAVLTRGRVAARFKAQEKGGACVGISPHTSLTRVTISVMAQAHLQPVVFPEVSLSEVVFPESVGPGIICSDHLQYLRKAGEHRAGGGGGAREEEEVRLSSSRAPSAEPGASGHRGQGREGSEATEGPVPRGEPGAARASRDGEGALQGSRGRGVLQAGCWLPSAPSSSFRQQTPARRVCPVLSPRNGRAPDSVKLTWGSHRPLSRRERPTGRAGRGTAAKAPHGPRLAGSALRARGRPQGGQGLLRTRVFPLLPDHGEAGAGLQDRTAQPRESPCCPTCARFPYSPHCF